MKTTDWDEPAGATPRGTLIVLPGRGETAATYERFGRRLAADAYRVRVVALSPDDLADPQDVTEGIGKLLADESLPAPKVLVGSDTGATLAGLLAPELPVDAVVLAGTALPGQAEVGGWEEEVRARTACPVHTLRISEDPSFARGAVEAPLPWSSVEFRSPGKPVLVLHGSADVLTPADDAVAAWSGDPDARVLLVEGGRHDVLNDVTHRSVAATIVLFLESLRTGPDLPELVRAVR